MWQVMLSPAEKNIIKLNTNEISSMDQVQQSIKLLASFWMPISYASIFDSLDQAASRSGSV